jgi:signal transduction histidine kinase
VTIDGTVTAGSDGRGHAESAWPRLDRFRSWAAQHGLAADSAFIGALLLLFAGVWEHRALQQPSLLVPILVQAALVSPLLLRRRHPLLVFAWLYLVALPQWWFGRWVLVDAALLVGLYAVAACRDRRYALLAAGLVETSAIVAAARWFGGYQNVLATVVFLSGLVTAAFVLGVNTRTRRAYLASLEDRAARAEREQDQRSQLAAATERARIAREMHDIVAHNLSVMIALADGVAFAVGQGDPQVAKGAAEQVSDTGRQALGEMQRLVGVLRGTDPPDPRAPQPGLDQIDDLLGQMRAAGLPTTFIVSGTLFPVPPSAQLAVYRVVQESLTNVLKHASNPSRVRVTVTYADPTIIVYVLDDGRSEPARSTGRAGHGLTGMRERAMVFGGHVDAGPGRHGGWQVRAILTCPRVAS